MSLSDTGRRVAVIGAGASGVAAAAHLLAEGLNVTVFEKGPVTGGVWVFESHLPPEPSYPTVKASLAETEFYGHPENDEPYIRHHAPGACYENLRTNAPTPLIEMSLNPWKPDTELYARHSVVADYIQETAARTGVHRTILHHTKVESVTKREEQSGWKVHTSTWGTAKGVLLKNWVGSESPTFDAVVVATGHYHAPYIPDIPGLAHWKQAWPNRIQHSKGYRSNKGFQDQVVLLIGAGASAVDIANELGPCTKRIWQSTRGSSTDHSLDMLPANATRVAEIASFGPLRNDASTWAGAIPGAVTLVDGQILEGIDRVVLCTGYLYSLPFLARYHRDDLSAVNADSKVLVTDGSQIHNLHKDIFYIPDPTLAFVGVPVDVASFSLFEFQAMAIAAVLSGQTTLPSEDTMRAEYDERVKERGHGKRFHSLLKKDVAYAAELMEWVNRGRQPTRMKSSGYSREWLDRRATFIEKYKGKGAHLKIEDTYPKLEGQAA
ncbi:hypothetical protein A1O3_00422 [Capronia epimyces CBS 606.96]|uniref:FAD dependent oxidoreductase domain-containing protein n=1 Tax=Capronia epimyces CBS 606.96 TaxID=1182542 RepID=W9YG87_9EURO|nr:uncharacterized protein A1O3_00422 [Capronia epimyces CBS 606.96]EXJ91872.1 hypothetical protein A1O3_00422 [Capronia epimyces CBS 606.96]